MCRYVPELCLPAANGGYDLKSVAILELLRGELTARHDLAVPLKRDALAGQPHFFDQ